MMPYCEYRRCKNVADKSFKDVAIGEVTGDQDGSGKPWKQPVYVCDKHYFKILALLGYKK